MTETPSPHLPSPAVRALAHGELAGLDGLRAFSVLAVMVGHFGFGNIVPGGLGVTVFFFISGFLITTLMLREARATGRVAIHRFYLRRMLRLQPELWAFLLISGILGLSFAEPLRAIDIFGAIFYFTNYIFAGALGGEVGHLRWPHLWSLAIEEHYYITFPLIFSLLISAPKRLMQFIAAILIGSLVIRVIYQHFGVSEFYIYAATETRIDSIAYGCFTALAIWFLPQSFRTTIARFGVLTAALAGSLLIASLFIRNPAFRDTLRYSLQGWAIACLFVFLFLTEFGSKIAGGLDWAPLKWMGRMSYGAYLWHVEIGGLVEHWIGLPFPHTASFSSAVSCVILSAITFAVAGLSFALLQRPVLALRHRLGAQV